eukprot:CAMPEP_0113272064 /NCGR_PEP_ID=MMETSP0008_2-20120614/23115_1 /TAXON_ID=97485 /ORGANISM="Prymnesium parvum" /LENGTH=78 /DNA_ID=CAMNT_0000121483 /DNA_START=251 /DNA_END=483 /DNA_ORIENTATION=+ /assembly_acc=CAM_ASM_000153
MTLPSIATLSGGTALLTDNEERLKVERLYSFFGGGLLNLNAHIRSACSFWGKVLYSSDGARAHVYVSLSREQMFVEVG